MNFKIYENSKISIFNETLISVLGTENGILCVVRSTVISTDDIRIV